MGGEEVWGGDLANSVIDLPDISDTFPGALGSKLSYVDIRGHCLLCRERTELEVLLGHEFSASTWGWGQWSDAESSLFRSCGLIPRTCHPFSLWNQSFQVLGALSKNPLPSVEQVIDKDRPGTGEEKQQKKENIKFISHLLEDAPSSESFIIKL